MKALLDTHVFLWWNTNDPRLSPAAHEVIAEGQNEVFVSVASAWEIAIKVGRGSLILPEPPELYVPDRLKLHHFRILPIRLEQALRVHGLPDIHRDPFDRLLIVQSQFEDLPILTNDAVIARYDVNVIW